jgi:hypothetical protein
MIQDSIRKMSESVGSIIPEKMSHQYRPPCEVKSHLNADRRFSAHPVSRNNLQCPGLTVLRNRDDSSISLGKSGLQDPLP